MGLNDFNKESEVKAIDTSRKLRIGVIGCGWIVGSHLKRFMRQPDIEIVAACDLIPGKAAAAMAEFGIEGVKTDYASHKEMLADNDNLKLDAVTICTYNCQHAGPAIDCLNAGINVLLEKPFTVTLEEAVEVMKAEKKSGKILSIGFQPRMDANMQMIKKIVQSGELGKIYYVQTGGGRRRGIPIPYGTSTTFIQKDTAGIGALGDIGCYSLDMVLNALGNPKPLTVSGFTSNYFGTDPNYVRYQNCGHPEYSKLFGVDDFAAAFIRLEGGIILDFRIAWAMNLDTPGDTIIMGTKGSLRIPSTDCWNGSVGGPMTIYHELCGEQTKTEVPIIPMEKDAFELKVRTFLDAIKEGGKAPVPSSEIIYNQAIIDGIAKSAALGREVEIEIPEI